MISGLRAAAAREASGTTINWPAPAAESHPGNAATVTGGSPIQMVAERVLYRRDQRHNDRVTSRALWDGIHRAQAGDLSKSATTRVIRPRAAISRTSIPDQDTFTVALLDPLPAAFLEQRAVCWVLRRQRRRWTERLGRWRFSQLARFAAGDYCVHSAAPMAPYSRSSTLRLPGYAVRVLPSLSSPGDRRPPPVRLPARPAVWR